MAIQYSIQKMVSDGTLSTIALGIQYLQRNDIYIRIAGEETPQSGAPSGYTWSFINNTTLKILPVVPNGVEVVVYRRTDVDVMYNVYSQNAQFDEATIDENNQQLLYIAQEYLEQGLPGAGVDTIEFLRDDGTNTYYRIKRTDGSYSEEFAVPSASSSTKVLTREALRRSYAEAGYNLVDGSFETGGTLVNANDVLLQELTGKAYSGPAGPVAAGTDPASGGFVNVSGAVYGTAAVAEINSGMYGVGAALTVSDRAGARFNVVAGGTPDGYGVLDAGGGNTAVYVNSGVIHPQHFGSSLEAWQYAFSNYGAITEMPGAEYDLGGGVLNIGSNFELVTNGAIWKNGTISARVNGLTKCHIGDLIINGITFEFGGTSSTQRSGGGNRLGNVYGIDSVVNLRKLSPGDSVGVLDVNWVSDGVGVSPFGLDLLRSVDMGGFRIRGKFSKGLETVGNATTAEDCTIGCTIGFIDSYKDPSFTPNNGHHGVYLHGNRDLTVGYIKSFGYPNNITNDVKFRNNHGCKIGKVDAGYMQLASDAGALTLNTTENNVINDVVIGNKCIITGSAGHSKNEIHNFDGVLINGNVAYTGDYGWKLTGDVVLKNTAADASQPNNAGIVFMDADVSAPNMLINGSGLVWTLGVTAVRTRFRNPVYTSNGNNSMAFCQTDSDVSFDRTSGTGSVKLHHVSIGGVLLTNSRTTRAVNADYAFVNINANWPGADDAPDGVIKYRYVAWNDRRYEDQSAFTAIA